jgi:limonene-1,2-epoxide hydrolase
MPPRLRPVPPDGIRARSDHPRDVVEAFLDALTRADERLVAALLDADVCWVNAGLPPLHGRRAVLRAVRAVGGRSPAELDICVHAFAVDGTTVLTERTDVITLGPLRLQFWVAGRFEVHGGRITLWHEAFDYLDVARSVVRGLAGVVVPALRPAPPTVDGLPGRSRPAFSRPGARRS